MLSLGIDTKLLILEGFVNHNSLYITRYRDNIEMDINKRDVSVFRYGGRSVIRNIFNFGGRILKVRPEFFGEINMLAFSSLDKIELSLHETEAKFLMENRAELGKVETKIGGNLNVTIGSGFNIQISCSIASDENKYITTTYGVGGSYRF
jgi:hypothetical protein